MSGDQLQLVAQSEDDRKDNQSVDILLHAEIAAWNLLVVSAVVSAPAPEGACLGVVSAIAPVR